ncbi:probable Laccase-1 [Armillaria ostoyae]|uniref:Probable Laccase-1 n=1 Tax=Armillaria ostoyae TaxID=47428 RepID=A0A284RI46_ARMOS|nr:probable Laccase-1 [Armillaria ostoyae]
MGITVVFLLLSFLSSVYGKTHRFPLSIDTKVIAPDGFARSAITPNGTFPGPTFKVNKGDDVHIVTTNNLADPGMRRSTSIHWHGFFQARTSVMDGPSFVNQCPIPPKSTFDYAFSTIGQSGNYWYHSHLSTQYCDGLRGAFIVYDPHDPLAHLYDVDDDSTIITLADWYHDLAPDAQNRFFQTGSVPIPDSGLINGVGRYNGGPLVPYSVIKVKRGKRYRLRLISISCRPFFTFSIDNHNISAMEFDGVEHDPVTVQNIDIYAAQRVSVILEANQPIGNYWIRAPPTGGNPAGNPNFNPDLTRAILQYEGAPDREPTTNNTPGIKLDDADMHPIAQEWPGKLGDGPPDVAYTLSITQPNPPFFDINGISYISPTVPVLLQILSGAAQPQDFLPSEQVSLAHHDYVFIVLKPELGLIRSTVRSVLNNWSSISQAVWTVHGHNFDIVRTSNSDVTNYVNPPRRDVVPSALPSIISFLDINVLAQSTAETRHSGSSAQDNPGAWFLHCHIDWHLEAGLAIVFAESPADNIEGPHAQVTPQDWLTLCPDYNALSPDLQ